MTGLTILLGSLMLLLMGCGGNDNGNHDTVLTGFSGVIIFGILAWIVFRIVRNRTK